MTRKRQRDGGSQEDDEEVVGASRVGTSGKAGVGVRVRETGEQIREAGTGRGCAT